MERDPEAAGHHRGMILTVAWRHERRPSNISYSLEVPCVNRGRSSHTALRPAHRFGIAAQVRQPLLLGPGNHSAYCGTAYANHRGDDGWGENRQGRTGRFSRLAAMKLWELDVGCSEDRGGGSKRTNTVRCHSFHHFM